MVAESRCSLLLVQITDFTLIAVTLVRKVQFQKEKLRSVAQSELFQMVCVTNYISAQI